MTPDEDLPGPGSVVADKYRIERVIGRGGMGVVMLAHHLILGQRVALKFMHPSLARVESAVRRFALEARASAKLKNEHSIRILDVDQLDDGTPYIVMEYLEGAS